MHVFATNFFAFSFVCVCVCVCVCVWGGGGGGESGVFEGETFPLPKYIEPCGHICLSSLQ